MTAQKVLQLSELEQDTAVRVEIDGVPMAVVLDANGEVHAIGDTCTHGDSSLSDGFVEGERSLAAFRVTFGASLLAALINAFFGLIVAWVLVRYPFPGKRFVDALVDLPFALPTAVAGITLATLYAGNGWLGSHLEPLGIKVAYTPLGIVFALGWTPCIGPALQVVLTLALNEATALRGAVLALCYALGLGLPFLIAGFAFDRMAGTVEFVRRHHRGLQVTGGVMMIAVGVLLITGGLLPPSQSLSP